MESLRQDLRYGLRTLLKSPAFVLVSVLSLALGIGANTTIFSVINAVVLRPLPYTDPDRLVTVYETVPARGQLRGWASTANFLDWERQNLVFDQMELTTGGPHPVTLSGYGEAQRVGAGLGRTFPRGPHQRDCAESLLLAAPFRRRSRDCRQKDPGEWKVPDRPWSPHAWLSVLWLGR